MPISEIKKGHVQKAIEECDRLGLDEFLYKYGFDRPEKRWLIYKGRPYPAKAIVGVAYKYVLPGPRDPFKAGKFSSGHIVRPLRKLGFEVTDTILGGVAADPENSSTAPAQTDLPLPISLEETQFETTVGQDSFAEKVRGYWKGKCAITGIECSTLFETCHIKPFGDCGDSPAERLDPNNGIYLAKHIHAAFDAGLIGMPSGEVRRSANLSSNDRRRLNLADGMRIQVTGKHRPYLECRYSKFLEANKR
jgi:hypothetical protein